MDRTGIRTPMILFPAQLGAGHALGADIRRGGKVKSEAMRAWLDGLIYEDITDVRLWCWHVVGQIDMLLAGVTALAFASLLNVDDCGFICAKLQAHILDIL